MCFCFQVDLSRNALGVEAAKILVDGGLFRGSLKNLSLNHSSGISGDAAVVGQCIPCAKGTFADTRGMGACSTCDGVTGYQDESEQHSWLKGASTLRADTSRWPRLGLPEAQGSPMHPREQP